LVTARSFSRRAREHCCASSHPRQERLIAHTISANHRTVCLHIGQDAEQHSRSLRHCQQHQQQQRCRSISPGREHPHLPGCHVLRFHVFN
jgi:hypothetical protein